MKRKTKPAIVGATDAELNQGIGYLPWIPPQGWNEDPLAHRHTEARLGVAAMRARAFNDLTFTERWIATQIHPGKVQAIGQTPVKPGDKDYVAAWHEERNQGCPAWREES